MARSSLIPTERPQLVKSTRSRYSTGGFEFTSKENQVYSSSSSHSQQPQQQQQQTQVNSSPEVVDTLRHQNRLLAQRNAMIMSKLKEMELKNVELTKEINLLKRTTTPPITGNKQVFEEILSIIENKTFNSFDQLLQCFKKVRSDEGLPVNDQLGILSDVISRPITSTPIEVGRSGSGTFAAFDIISHDPLLNYFKPKDEDVVTNKNKDKDISIIFEESIEMASESTDLNHETKEEILVEREKKPFEKIQVELKGVPDKVKQLLQEEHEDKPEKIEKLPMKAKSKSKKTKSTEEVGVDLPKQQQQQQQQQQQEVAKTKKVVTKSSKKSSKKDPKPPVVVKIEEEGTRRSMRARKPIDYKPLSMRDKMRRESVAMLDAVGPDVLINYTQKPSSRGSSSGSVTSKRKSETPEVERKKRKPLTAVNTNINKVAKLGKEKSEDAEHYDLSVYDFEPEEKKVAPVYDKINVKNRIRG